MRFITGDETGLLKEITIRNGSSNNSSSSSETPHTFINNNNNIKIRRINPRDKQSRSRSILSLAPLSQTTSSFAALRIDNTIDFWRRSTTTTTTTTTTKDLYVKYRTIQNVGRSTPLSLKPLTNASRINNHNNDDDESSCRCLMAAIDTMGTISILDDATIRTTYDTTSSSSSSDGTKGTISAFDVAGSTAAVGGRDRETVVVDLERGEVTWRAKNLPPDRQTLLDQPLWGSTLTFLSPTTTLPLPPNRAPPSPLSSSSSHPSPLLAVGTAHKHVRLYDIRLQRRPVATTPYHDKTVILSHRLTCLKQVDDYRLIGGDTAGFVHSLDVRKLEAVEGRYVGPAGSVRDMVVVGEGGSGGGVVGSVGLDRHLWCHDVTTRRVMEKVYLKQRLNCVMMGWEDGEEEEEEEMEGGREAPDVVRDYVDSDDEEEEEEDGVAVTANKRKEVDDDDDEDDDGAYVSGSSEEGEDEESDEDDDSDDSDDDDGEEQENYIDLSGDDDDDDDDDDGSDSSDSDSDDEDGDKPQPSSKRRKT